MRREDGFTLIEILVVILIIAILAVIAIPVFLQQRQDGWVSQTQAALKNAATSAESYATENEGSYAGIDGADSQLNNAAYQELAAQAGFRKPPDVRIEVAADSERFCVTATHSELPAGHPWKISTYNSAAGEPRPIDIDPPCT